MSKAVGNCTIGATATYDSQGRQTSVTDQMGRTTQYQYDTYGRLTAVVQAAVVDPNTGQLVQPRTEYTYDNYGNLLTEKDALGRVTSFTYDPFGHETSRTLPQSQGDSTPPIETMSYDNYGRQSTHTDFAGNVTVYHYDTLGRLEETDYYQAGHNPSTDPPEEKVTTQYDSLGRVSQVTDSVYGTVTYGYDLDNRLIQEITPEGEIDYGYHAATGWHTSTTTANSGIDYNYDVLGRLTSVHVVMQHGQNLVSLGADQTQSYTYDDDGNVTHTELDQGTLVISTSDYTYDRLNRVQTLVQKDGSGTQLAKYTYQRLANGNVSEVDESLLQPDGTTQTNTVAYQYDAANRLTEEKLTSRDSSLTQTTDYTLDLVGNRVQEVIATPSQTETIGYQYDARDRLLSVTDSLKGTTSYGYDVNGNQTSQTNPDGSTVTYQFDLRGRMVQATAKTSAGGVLYVESLTYNADGIRTSTTLNQNSTTTTNRYLIDGLNPTGYAQVLEELDSTGALVASYAFGLLGPISQLRNAQTNYYLLDGHSGVRQLLSTAGAVTAAYLYGAFGTLLYSAGSVPNFLLYRGQWFDSILGQYYLRARFYDPTTGRFTAMDPTQGLLTSPLSLLKYLYALADPLNHIDPTGRMTLGVAVGYTALVGGLAGMTGGAIVGFLRGRDLRSAIIGSIVGGLVGVIVGSILGTTVWNATRLLATSNKSIFWDLSIRHPVSQRWFLYGLIIGAVVGVSAPEYGYAGLLFAVTGFAPVPAIVDCNFFIWRHPEEFAPYFLNWYQQEIGGMHPQSGRPLIRHDQIRAGTVYFSHFLVGYALSFITGLLVCKAVEQTIDEVNRLWPSPGGN